MNDKARSLREFGALINRLRKSQGMTQDQLATSAGVSRRWLSALENAERPSMDVSAVLRVIEALGLVLQLVPDVEANRPSVLDETGDW